MERLQAARSREGSQCFASSAREVLMGSEAAKEVAGAEKRRRVVTLVARMR